MCLYSFISRLFFVIKCIQFLYPSLSVWFVMVLRKTLCSSCHMTTRNNQCCLQVILVQFLKKWLQSVMKRKESDLNEYLTGWRYAQLTAAVRFLLLCNLSSKSSVTFISYYSCRNQPWSRREINPEAHASFTHICTDINLFKFSFTGNGDNFR